MKEVLPAHVVGAYDAGPVVHILVLQHSVRTGPVILEGEVPGREEVLGGQYVKLVLGPLGVGEEGSPICQLGVRGLRVVHRKGVRIVCPGLVRGEERYSLAAFPLGEIVGHERGA